MAANSEPVRLDLTAEQKEKLKALLGKDVDALEFTAEELEQRIAPKLAAN